MADSASTSIVSPLTIALVSGAVSILVALLSGLLSGYGAARLQRQRLRAELKLEFATETAIRDLLGDSRFKGHKRSFAAIKKRLPGFTDDELRRHLIRAGAISFRKHGTEGDEAELWGLRELVKADDVWKETD